MKPSPPTARGAAETHEHKDQMLILLPDPRVLRVVARSVLRLIARSVLLAAAILSFPCLRTMLPVGGGPTTLAAPPAAAADETDPKWVDNPFTLRMLVADLKREGLLSLELHNIFLGDPGSRAPFLKKNNMDLMSPGYKKLMVEDNSVDFVLAADGLRDSSFGFVDRVLKVGGIVTVRLGSDPSRSFHLPSNYRVAYIRRFGSTIVAIKKISQGNVGEFKGGGLRGRRLSSATRFKKTVHLREGFIG